MQEKEAISKFDSTLSVPDKAYHDLFYTIHPKLFGHENSSENAVLVLGPARSGTSWLSHTLSLADNVKVFFNEPLFHIKPALPFGELNKQMPYFLRNDHSSAPYTKKLSEEHPLCCAYKALLNTSFKNNKLFQETEINPMQLNSHSTGKVLIKEVHALLASEGLIPFWKGKIIVITRNPVYAVDSLLHYRSLKAHMWRKESQHVYNDSFLQEYFPTNSSIIKNYFEQYIDDGKSRTDVIMSKVLTVSIINQMLQTLAIENKKICSIRYEDLCKKPEVTFSNLANFSGLKMGLKMKDFIRKSSTSEAPNDPTPYSVIRNSIEMPTRPFKFISDNELKSIKHMLKICGLNNQLNT